MVSSSRQLRLVCCLLLAAVSWLGGAAALYSPASDVVQLTPQSFKSKVVQADQVVLVEFYAPWCGHCKNLVPEWEKAAKALRGIVTVAALDADAHKSLSSDYSIQGFPTIKVFTNGKASDYTGQRTAKAITDFAIQTAQKLVNQRLSGKKGKSSGESGGGGDGGGGDEAVVKLDGGNFESLVVQSDDLCGHCKKLAPEWAKAAKKLKGKVKLGAVDCDVEVDLARKYGVQGFPTIKLFGVDKRRPEDYNEARTASAIITFAERQLESFIKPKPVVELTGDKPLEEVCPSSCVIAFLPHILDTGAKGRNDHVEVLKSVADKLKGRAYNYFWVEGGQQLQLEEAVGVGGYGYPAIVAVKPSALAYAPAKVPFTASAIKDFLSENVRLIPMSSRQVPDLAQHAPWDGKDGEIIEADEFDLADLMGED
eukprot:jgi/Chlat1/8333/Chrsp8S08092